MEPGGATVADLVEVAAARHPDAVAAVAGAERLTYAELDQRANHLARRLQALGAGPDVPVGVTLGRSLDLAVALVAVLKAGGACVPLDPGQPAERLAHMVDDAAPVAILRGATAGVLEFRGVPAIPVGACLDPHPPARSIGPEHLAYVIYTSGTTGQAKGVMLTHRGLVNHHRAVVDLYALGPGDRVLQFCALGFDASIEEMFPTWAAGGTVVFRPDDRPVLGKQWLEWLRAQRITVLNLPTAYWHAWTRDVESLGATVPDDLRLVIAGGEKALGPAYRSWRRLASDRCRWINVYGPTETTCMSTFYEAPPGGGDGGRDGGGDGGGDGLGDPGDPPIGRPIAGTTVSVVDDVLKPVPPGAVGELLIGGAGLARGYLNQPRLTAERFVDTGSGRMYRTGDLVRLLPTGDLDFVGRIDDQVKIRGFRVECAEVEAALARHPEVAAAAVAARDNPPGQPGDRQLVAYVVATVEAAPTADELRRFLAGRLPAYMLPAGFVVLDELPLTSTGKVDRAALPDPVRSRPAPGVRPRSPTEERIVAIWARVLDVEPAGLGVEDDFFELGGHSLLAAQVIAQVRDEFGTDTRMRAIFETPTVAGLAAVVESEVRPSRGRSARLALAAAPRRPGERVPLSLAQEQMWRLETSATPPGLYNVTALHRFERPVDEVALTRALAWLADRHETLRTGFGVEDGRPYQQVVATPEPELTVTRLGAEPERELRERIAGQDASPFDLSRPPLWRVGLFHAGGQPSRMAVTVDHLVCDGNGIAVLLRELLAAYEAFAAGRSPELPPLPLQFADFAVWQRSHLTRTVLQGQLDWWARTLEGMPLGPAVPFDHVPAEPTRRIASRPVTVGGTTRAMLAEVARATGSTVFVVALAATQALLARAGGTTDVVVSTTLSGRDRAELEGLVGMFSGISRVRTDLSGDPPFAEVVARVRERVLGMFENQDIPFMQVRRALFPHFPTEGIELAGALPVEFQYFHSRRDDPELYFRGQLHPLSITLLDSGTQIDAELSYKLDFYEPATIERLAAGLECVLAAVGADASLRLSRLPVSPPAQP